MPSRRANPNAVKLNRSYTVGELATVLGVHKNTVRGWQRNGLRAVDDGYPILFHGAGVRDFLRQRNTDRKRPCPPGTLYCFRCREPRAPIPGLVDYVEVKPGYGNLQAMCSTCETIMHRRIRRSLLPVEMRGVAVQFREAPKRLSGSPSSSLNSDLGRRRPT